MVFHSLNLQFRANLFKRMHIDLGSTLENVPAREVGAAE